MPKLKKKTTKLLNNNKYYNLGPTNIIYERDTHTHIYTPPTTEPYMIRRLTATADSRNTLRSSCLSIVT